MSEAKARESPSSSSCYHMEILQWPSLSPLLLRHTHTTDTNRNTATATDVAATMITSPPTNIECSQDQCCAIVLCTILPGSPTKDQVHELVCVLGELLDTCRDGVPLSNIALTQRTEYVEQWVKRYDNFWRENGDLEREHLISMAAQKQALRATSTTGGVEAVTPRCCQDAAVHLLSESRDSPQWAKVPCKVRLIFDIRHLTLKSFGKVQTFFSYFDRLKIRDRIEVVLDRTLVVTSPVQSALWKAAEMLFRPTRPLKCITRDNLEDQAAWIGFPVHHRIPLRRVTKESKATSLSPSISTLA